MNKKLVEKVVAAILKARGHAYRDMGKMDNKLARAAIKALMDEGWGPQLTSVDETPPRQEREGG